MTKYSTLLSQTSNPVNWKEFSRTKIISPETIGQHIELIRNSGLTIATINGSFDLLHAGHLHILFEASQAADVLVVALNSDDSIGKYKSKDRPIIPLEYRLEMITALGFVDYATWFEETDPREILGKIKPNVHINGSEYGQNCIEAATVEKNGGEVRVVSLVPGLSTSEIISKIYRTGKEKRCV